MSKMTKKALASSLKKLMEQKPLSKITVTDITEECGINRHTFYYHFQDIFDLVEWIYLTEAEEAISAPGAPGSWEEGLRRLFTYGQENKRFVMGTYESFQKEHLQKFTQKHVEILVCKVLSERAESQDIPDSSIEFLISFYTYAYTGVILNWIENGMKEDPDTVIKMLARTLTVTFRDLQRQFLTI